MVLILYSRSPSSSVSRLTIPLALLYCGGLSDNNLARGLHFHHCPLLFANSVWQIVWTQMVICCMILSPHVHRSLPSCLTPPISSRCKSKTLTNGSLSALHPLFTTTSTFYATGFSEIGRFFSVCHRREPLIANWFAATTEFKEGLEGAG